MEERFNFQTNSRIEEILKAIKDGVEYTGQTYSRIEGILKAIANKSSYTLPPTNRIEEALLKVLKEGGESFTIFTTKNGELFVLNDDKLLEVGG